MPTAAVTTPSTAGPHAGVGTPDVERSASLAGFGGGGGRRRSHTVSVTMPARQARAESRVQTQTQTRERRGSSPVGYRVGEEGRQHELSDEMVGVLDCVDPQVATMNHLQNMTNSVMFPYLPSVWSRRPDIRLSPDSSDESLAPLQPQPSQPSQSQGDGHPVPPAPGTRFRSASASSRRGSLSLSLGRLITGRGRGEEEEGGVKSAPAGGGWEGEGAHPLAIPEEEPAPAPTMDDSALDTATSKTTTQPPTALSKPSHSR
ncbi:hypothetical protein B9479_008234, partial [Cryptococcus floricola]